MYNTHRGGYTRFLDLLLLNTFEQNMSKLPPWQTKLVGENLWNTLGEYAKYVVNDRQNGHFVQKQMKAHFGNDNPYMALYKCVMITQIMIGLAKAFDYQLWPRIPNDNTKINDWYIIMFSLKYDEVNNVIKLVYNSQNYRLDEYHFNSRDLMKKYTQESPIIQLLCKWSWYREQKNQPPYTILTLNQCIQNQQIQSHVCSIYHIFNH